MRRLPFRPITTAPTWAETINGYPIKLNAEYVNADEEYGPNLGTHPHCIVVRGVWAGTVLAECVGDCQWENCHYHADGEQIALSGFGWSTFRPDWLLVEDGAS
jgi:hypothetical protein